jgi:hypothetical protein
MRHGVRTAVVLAGVALTTFASSPAAYAVYRDDGDDPGPGMAKPEAVLIFGGIPLAVFFLVALLVYAPSLARGQRYRPDLGWWAQPVWFRGPAAGLAAVPPPPSERLATGVSVGESPAGTPVGERGGVSARW